MNHVCDCGREFDCAFPFGANVTCAGCGAEWETEMEEDYDNLYWWLTRKVVPPTARE